MLRPLIVAAAFMALPAVASAHALFPGTQTVMTVGERAIARFQAVNGRRDVSDFVVELFDRDWSASRHAVALPERLKVQAPSADEHEGTQSTFSVFIDLAGQPEQFLRVCTKSILTRDLLKPQSAKLSTRVCVNVTARKFKP